MVTKLGKSETEGGWIEVEKIKETDKAIALKVTEKTRRGIFKAIEWLPKSQIKQIGIWIEAPEWLLQNKSLPQYELPCTLSNNKLLEKKKLSLSELTIEDRISLLSEGFVRAEEKYPGIARVVGK